MIDFKISQIFGILGVGIFIVISIIYFYFLVQRLFHIKKHNKDAFFFWLQSTLKEDYQKTGYAVITALLVYSVGLLAQDLTDHMTDSERNFNPLISFVRNTSILDNEGELRKKTLVQDADTLTGLGSEVFDKARLILDTSLSHRDIPFFNDGQPVKKYWQQYGNAICKNDSVRKEFVGFINNIYYTSKNWCYLYAPPIREELEAIQERIDFARSICIIAFLVILAVMFIYCNYFIWEICKRKKRRFMVVTTENNRWRIRRRVFYPFRAAILLSIIFLAAKICYSAAEKNFNERAMGYYVSHFKYSESKTQK